MDVKMVALTFDCFLLSDLLLQAEESLLFEKRLLVLNELAELVVVVFLGSLALREVILVLGRFCSLQLR